MEEIYTREVGVWEIPRSHKILQILIVKTSHNVLPYLVSYLMDSRVGFLSPIK